MTLEMVTIMNGSVRINIIGNSMGRHAERKERKKKDGSEHGS